MNIGGGDRWRHIAERIAEVDREYRIRRPRDYGLGDNPDGDLQFWVEKIIVAARHLAEMLHNGIDYEGNVPETRLARVYRRIRFEHHGLYLPMYHMMLQQRLPEGWDIPGGTALYEDLLPYSRRLQFGDGAVQLDADERHNEFARFRAVVEDQLNVRCPPMALAQATVDNDVQSGIWTRTLLEPVLR